MWLQAGPGGVERVRDPLHDGERIADAVAHELLVVAARALVLVGRAARLLHHQQRDAAAAGRLDEHDSEQSRREQVCGVPITIQPCQRGSSGMPARCSARNPSTLTNATNDQPASGCHDGAQRIARRARESDDEAGVAVIRSDRGEAVEHVGSWLGCGGA